MLACLPAPECWCATESLTLTNCDRLFYCHPIMRNKTVAEELMSGMFPLFLLTLSPLHPFHLDSCTPRSPPPHPSIFIILPHPNNNTAASQHKTRGPWPNESHAFAAVKWPVSITSCISLSHSHMRSPFLSLLGSGIGLRSAGVSGGIQRGPSRHI